MLILATASTAQAAPVGVGIGPACQSALAPRLCAIHRSAHLTDRIRVSKGYPRLRYGYAAERQPQRRGWFLWLWRTRAARARALPSPAVVPEPYYSALMCIHGGEGSMVSLNPAGPYYGGWQMDSSFEAHWGADMLAKYGGRDARYWSAHDQLIVAYRAARAIGYGSWPQTAAACGLL